MNIYEQGLKNLREADVALIMIWIRERAQGKYHTPLDSAYTASRVETSSLIHSLYEQSDHSTQQKLRESLDLLLAESTSQRNFDVLLEVIFSIGKIGYDFPNQVLIQFVIDNASSTDVKDVKAKALALLQGYIEGSNEIYRLYTEWYWSDPVTVGPEHALQLFAGLIAINPNEFPRLLIRLNEINKTLPAEEQFQPQWIWGIIVDNCSEEELQNGLSQLPMELSAQLTELRQEDPDLYSCE